MKLVIITGPHAVGKMSVGQKLAEKTKLKLFHNHMSIEIVVDLFENNRKEMGRIITMIRKEIFEAYSKSDEYGMIFTYMWAFDMQEDWDEMNNLESLFVSKGADVYFVELEANKDVRLIRNKTENRLQNKPSKRNLENSERLFNAMEEKYRLNSLEGEVEKKHYLRINNTNLEPDEVAELIKNEFDL